MELFNNGWQFKMETDDDTAWQAVPVPHDWLIHDARRLYAKGVGCYKKIFNPGYLTPGQKVFLRFDGVYMDCCLYVNGEPAGEWKYGYTAFIHDITPFLQPGNNELLLTVTHESPNSRWYTGAGIYRDCWLIVKNATHFIPDGINITPKKMGDYWHVSITAEVACEMESTNRADVACEAKSTCGADVACEAESTYRADVACETENTCRADVACKPNVTFENNDYSVRHMIVGLNCETLSDGSLRVKNPALWDINNPTCYILESELLQNGQITDIVKTRFGFREIAFSPAGGFMLNGRRVELNGVCQHHDLGALGAAVHKDALRRQLLILKDMGANAIRTAHNPPAAVFIELADEMGFLVMSEFSDMWKRRKTTYDYARFFEEWVERDVASWIRRDRNCPSIIMWSIGNEIYDTHADAEGAETMKMLMDLVKTHDPHGHAPPTLCSNYMPWENTQNCADIIKLMGYNYAEYLYHNHHAAHPDWIIYGAETASTVQSRGIYHFPLSKALLSDDDLQCSSLGNSATSWGAKNTEACIINHRDTTFTLGQFIWTGFDYIGEPTPYHTKNSYFGQIDTAGFPKDSFYMYQSAWTDYKEKPMVHLLPYWDWSPGQPVDVRIYSNAPRVELFLNGKSLGAAEIGHRTGQKLSADYIVPYEPGCIKAVAYDENGQIIAEAERRSFGDAQRLEMNHTRIGELIFTEIYAVDADGNPVGNANNRVNIKVRNGTLLGIDSGDSTDYDQYKGNSKRLFSGKLLAIVKPDAHAKDTISTEINSECTVSTELNSECTISAEIDSSDTPIRKIELSSEGHSIKATIFPENATYNDLRWRLTDDAGIDSPLGSIIPNGREATLVPKGDGGLYVRCATENGKNHISLISLLPVTFSGYGEPFLDPYAFVSGGLYNISNVPMANGNERGIATLRDGESHVGFAGLDFGSFGSDEITMWLFPLGGNPFPIEIWLGMPNDGRQICTVTYDKGSVWNTYKEVTYKLPEKLRDVQTFSFVFRQKVHIKGFQFTTLVKAYQTLPFTENNHIYGDSFQITENAIERVGNNVTITFDNMDFEDGAGFIEICWQAEQNNTIRIVHSGTNKPEQINSINLPAQRAYGSAQVPLEIPINGKGAVSFIFLPGSDINLSWFRFIR